MLAVTPKRALNIPKCSIIRANNRIEQEYVQWVLSMDKNGTMPNEVLNELLSLSRNQLNYLHIMLHRAVAELARAVWPRQVTTAETQRQHLQHLLTRLLACVDDLRDQEDETQERIRWEQAMAQLDRTGWTVRRAR